MTNLQSIQTPRPCVRSSGLLAFLAVLLLSLIPVQRLLQAEDAPPADKASAAKVESLKVMQARANRIFVKIPVGTELRRADLVDKPLIHYADQVRNLPESTLWVWQQEGIPVLFCKIEQLKNSQTGVVQWQNCCVPATGEKVDVEWDRQFRWRASESGFKWVPLVDESDPRDQAPARLTQMRTIVRAFGGETEQTPNKSRQKMRLLTSPLHRFAAPGKNVVDGAVFGLTSNGTNPDVLIVIEALLEPDANARWRFAVLGMTGDAVQVVNNEQTVWTKPYTSGPGDHRSWMWYIATQ